MIEEEKLQQQNNMLIESKTISFSIRRDIENNAEQLQLFINHWQSIEEINQHWQGDISALIRVTQFIKSIKLFPIIDEDTFDLPEGALIKANSEIQRKSQLRARSHLPTHIEQVISSFVYSSRVSFTQNNEIELYLQFPIIIDEELVAYMEASLDIGNLLRYKVDTYQINKPFSISENGTTIFSSLPENMHINDIRQQFTFSVYDHIWKVMVWASVSPPNKDLFLIFTLLISFSIAITTKLIILNKDLYIKNKVYNKQLKRVDEEYRSSQAKLLQSNKLTSLGEIASGIAHEINQPLQIICIHSDLCLENLNNENYHLVRKNFKAIVDQSERIEKIVKQVGSFGRDSESDGYQQEDANDIFKNVISIVMNQYKQDNVELRQIIQPTLPSLYCNKTQIEQVLINLLINARDSVETSEKKVVFFKAQVQNHSLYIQVSDSGTGIDPNKINDIFTPFYTTKPLGKGTGLGLSISYSIIAQHKGEIKVTSEIGQGSVFTVKLPFKKQKNNRV